jgi:hypothetical protein
MDTPIGQMSIAAIADELHKRLLAISNDRNPNTNPVIKGHITKFYDPEAKPVDRYVSVRSCIGCPETFLTQEQAGLYLRWLRAGNVGTHWEVRLPLDEKTTPAAGKTEGLGHDSHHVGSVYQ